MKLLLDEMLSPAIARDLRAHGHDAESVAGHPDRETLSDPEVLALSVLGTVLWSPTTCVTSARYTTRRSHPAGQVTSA